MKKGTVFNLSVKRLGLFNDSIHDRVYENCHWDIINHWYSSIVFNFANIGSYFYDMKVKNKIE